MKSVFLVSSAIATAWIMAAPAWAQQSTASATEPKPDEAAAPDIVVTAQHREERLQDIPASITAVSEETLAGSGFSNPTDIQYLAPTVTFNPVQGAGFQIRGVGTQGFDYSMEKSISVVVDDIVQGLPRTVGVSTLADVQRIEVLRGPQGTLFGKNASGGVVYVVTNRPKLGETTVSGRARYGTDNEIQLQNVINVPLGEQAAFRLASVYNRRDGYMRNKFLNKDLGSYSDLQFTGKLLVQPTDTFEMYLIADYLHHKDTGQGLVQTLRKVGVYNPATASTRQNIQPFLTQYGIVPGPKNEDVMLDQANGAVFTTGSATLTLAKELGDFTLMSISGYKYLDYDQTLDSDQAPNNFFSFNHAPIMEARQFTQEFRLNSPVGGFVDYTLGLYYYRQHIDAAEIQYGGFNRVLPPNTQVALVGANAYYTANTRSLAAFGQGNLNFSDTLKAVVGLRYTRDSVNGSFDPRPGINPILVPQTTTFAAAERFVKANNLSGRVSLQYKPSDDIMVFATYSRGYKAPAVGTTRGQISTVTQEDSENYELGFKTQFFDRFLTLNATAFFTKFKGFQAQTLITADDGSLIFRLANAKGLESKGVEIDAALRFSRAFSLTFGGAYAPSKYTGFITSCYPGQAVRPTPGPGCYAVTANGVTQNIFEAAGQPLIQAPKYSASVTADFQQPLTDDLQLMANAVYSYRSKVFSVVGDPQTIVVGYGIVNGTVGVGPEDGRWKIGLYTRNLFDKHYVGRISAQNYVPLNSYSQLPVTDARRTVGVSLDYRF